MVKSKFERSRNVDIEQLRELKSEVQKNSTLPEMASPSLESDITIDNAHIKYPSNNFSNAEISEEELSMLENIQVTRRK